MSSLKRSKAVAIKVKPKDNQPASDDIVVNTDAINDYIKYLPDPDILDFQIIIDYDKENDLFQVCRADGTNRKWVSPEEVTEDQVKNFKTMKARQKNAEKFVTKQGGRKSSADQAIQNKANQVVTLWLNDMRRMDEADVTYLDNYEDEYFGESDDANDYLEDLNAPSYQKRMRKGFDEEDEEDEVVEHSEIETENNKVGPGIAPKLRLQQPLQDLFAMRVIDQTSRFLNPSKYGSGLQNYTSRRPKAKVQVPASSPIFSRQISSSKSPNSVTTLLHTEDIASSPPPLPESSLQRSASPDKASSFNLPPHRRPINLSTVQAPLSDLRRRLTSSIFAKSIAADEVEESDQQVFVHAINQITSIAKLHQTTLKFIGQTHIPVWQPGLIQDMDAFSTDKRARWFAEGYNLSISELSERVYRRMVERKHKVLLASDRRHSLHKIYEVLASSAPGIILSAIQGRISVSRKMDKEFQKIIDRNMLSDRTPSIYLNEINEFGTCLPPLITHMRELVKRLGQYATDDRYALRIDRVKGIKTTHHFQDREHGSRLQERRYFGKPTVKDPNVFDRRKRRLDLYVKLLEKFLDEEEASSIDDRLSRPLTEVGYATHPNLRLKQHRNHHSSNFLMNLVEIILQQHFPANASLTKFRGYQLKQHILMNCWDPSHAPIGEAVFSELSQCYMDQGKGFSYCHAGLSTGKMTELPLRLWFEFHKAFIVDGPLMKNYKADIKAIKSLLSSYQQSVKALERTDPAEKLKELCSEVDDSMLQVTTELLKATKTQLQNFNASGNDYVDEILNVINHPVEPDEDFANFAASEDFIPYEDDYDLLRELNQELGYEEDDFEKH
jgi:hypothetical protein